MNTKQILIPFILVLTIIILAGVVLIRYWHQTSGGAEVSFAKEDYRIEERDDATYIVMDRVGFTAKVPNGWAAEIKYDDLPGGRVEYWVSVASSDLEGYPEIGQGCGFSIGTTIDEVLNQKIKDEIKFVQENPTRFEELGYNIEYATPVMVSGKSAFFWISPGVEPPMRQITGVTIPWGGDILLSLSSGTVPGYNEVCLPIWNEFLTGVVIE